MSDGKLSPKLAETLQDSSDESPVDLVLELHDPPAPAHASSDRAQQIAARKQAFSKHAESVAGEVRSLGGEVTGEAWINSTLKVRIPRSEISRLSAAPQVKKLDLPHALQPDTSK